MKVNVVAVEWGDMISTAASRVGNGEPVDLVQANDQSFPVYPARKLLLPISDYVDVNDPIFLAPESMKAAFDSKLPHPPKCAGGYFRCAYRSLAEGYRQAIGEIEKNTGRKYSRLYIVGGGARNAFLNRLTEEAAGIRVVALPIEATAMGNLKIQMEVER